MFDWLKRRRVSRGVPPAVSASEAIPASAAPRAADAGSTEAPDPHRDWETYAFGIRLRDPEMKAADRAFVTTHREKELGRRTVVDVHEYHVRRLEGRW